MQSKIYTERIERTENIYIELMDLVFRMQMNENVDYHKVMSLLKESYTDQLTLIDTLYKYEKVGVQ